MSTFEEMGREKLRELLSKVPSESKFLFDRMYGSVDTIPIDKIDWAIQQCERTIEKQRKRRRLLFQHINNQII